MPRSRSGADARGGAGFAYGPVRVGIRHLRAVLLAASVAAAPIAAPAAAELSLLAAAEAGERARALALLEEGGDVDERGPDGATPLMWAAYRGDLELVERLVAAGADVEARNAFGTSALAEAAIQGDAAIIAALLAAGADPNAANPEGETPLMTVARTGNVAAARLLVTAGANVNATERWGGQSALMWAAAQSQPEMVAFLAESGADVDARGVIRQWPRKVITEPRPKDMNKGGFTPLLYAAREGCVECARRLIEAGADPNLADPERVTPLNMALLNLHFDLAAYLIEAGADPQDGGSGGIRRERIPADPQDGGSGGIRRERIPADPQDGGSGGIRRERIPVDVDKWDLFGRTPLYMAADVSTLPVKGNGSMSVLPSMDELTALDVARRLLEAGADPNIRLKRRPPYRDVPQDRGGDRILAQGATPLLRAARAGDAAFVELLLEHGALVDLPSKEGVTPLMAAAGVEYGLRVTRGRNRTEEGVLATLELLLAAGADVNARMVTEPSREFFANAAQQAQGSSYARRGRQVPSPYAVPHRAALHGAAMRGFNSVIELLAAHGADLEARDADGRTPLDLARGDYEEDFLTQGPEPLPETVALLERLIAERAAAAAH